MILSFHFSEMSAISASFQLVISYMPQNAFAQPSEILGLSIELQGCTWGGSEGDCCFVLKQSRTTYYTADPKAY